MSENRLYPIIIQTWLQGTGSSLMSGTYDDAQILKWAKEETLKWNEPRCPQENEIIFKQTELGSNYYLWGFIRCGGVEEHGRSFIEIRSILLDKSAILPNQNELKDKLLAFDFLTTKNPNDWKISIPIRTEPKDLDANNPSEPVIELSPIIEQVRPFLKKTIRFFMSILQRIWKLFFSLWQERKEIWAKTKELWKNRKELWNNFTQTLIDWKKHPEKIWPYIQDHSKQIGISFLVIFIVVLFFSYIFRGKKEIALPTIQPTVSEQSIEDIIKNLEGKNPNKYTWQEFQQYCQTNSDQLNERSNTMVEGKFYLETFAEIWQKIHFPERPSKISHTGLECSIVLDNGQYRIDIQGKVSDLLSLPCIVAEYKYGKIVLTIDGQIGKVSLVEGLESVSSNISHVIIPLHE